MKVILYMAITANGFIAKDDDNTSFVSEVEWKNFKKAAKQKGNLIIGRRTYEIMEKEKGFLGLAGIKTVVVTKKSVVGNKRVLLAQSPKEALGVLKKHGFKEALVAGGGTLNASFIKENLIDEIYLDIEPALLGEGIRLFAESNFEKKLKLLGLKKFSQNEIQLRYKVFK